MTVSEAADAGHRDVEHEYVGLDLRIGPERVLTTFGLRHHLHVRTPLQQQAKTHAHDRVVVHQHDPDRHRTHTLAPCSTATAPATGRVTRTRTP